MENMWVMLGGIATIIIALITFFQWRSKKVLLRVEVRRYPFELPRDMLESLAELKYIKNHLDNDGKDQEKEELINKLCVLADKYKLNGYSTPDAVDFISMENKGNDEIKNINISLRGLAFYLPENEDWNKKENVISIPAIQPGEKIEIKAWSSSLSFGEVNVLMGNGRPCIVKYEMFPAKAKNIFAFIESLKFFSLILIVLVTLSLAKHFYNEHKKVTSEVEIEAR